LPRELGEAFQALETRADECWRTLELLRRPSNIAPWALLTSGVVWVERAPAAPGGSNTPHFDAMLGNLSRLFASGVKWALWHGLFMHSRSSVLDMLTAARLGNEPSLARLRRAHE
jgi:hypothetical protein